MGNGKDKQECPFVKKCGCSINAIEKYQWKFCHHGYYEACYLYKLRVTVKRIKRDIHGSK